MLLQYSVLLCPLLVLSSYITTVFVSPSFNEQTKNTHTHIFALMLFDCVCLFCLTCKSFCYRTRTLFTISISFERSWHHFCHLLPIATAAVDVVCCYYIFFIRIVFIFSPFFLSLVYNMLYIRYMNGIISLYIQFVYCILNVNPMRVHAQSLGPNTEQPRIRCVRERNPYFSKN